MLSRFSNSAFLRWLRSAPTLATVSFAFLCLTWLVLQPSIWLLAAFLVPVAEIAAKFQLGFSTERYRTLALVAVVLVLHPLLLTLSLSSTPATLIPRLIAGLQYAAVVLLGLGVGLFAYRKSISSVTSA